MDTPTPAHPVDREKDLRKDETAKADETRTPLLDDLEFASDPDFVGTVESSMSDRVEDCVEPG